MTDKIEKACTYLAETHSAQFAQGYGEPGYTGTPRGVILANWNGIPSGLADWLEKCGFSLEWYDEWIICNRGKAYRISPDSYFWECSVSLTVDCEYLTPDDSAADWIDDHAISSPGQPIKCLPSRISAADLEAEGFTLRAADLESGMHPGQTADADRIAREAFKDGATRVVFRKTENSQFYVRFECWESDE